MKFLSVGAIIACLAMSVVSDQAAIVAKTIGKGHLVLQREVARALPKACVVFAPGASLVPKQYGPIFEKLIQLTEFQDTVALILKFPFDNVFTQKQFNGIVEEAVSELLADFQQSNPHLNVTSIPFFFGGHSRGGISMQDLMQELYNLGSTVDNKQVSVPAKFLVQNSAIDQNDPPGQTLGKDVDLSTLLKVNNAGMILFSATLARKYRPDQNGSFRDVYYPIFTIGGDMDGLFRPFRLAEQYYHESLSEAYPEISSREKYVTRPVLVVRGASHMSFASGLAPIFVKLNDNRAQIGDLEAHEKIAKSMAYFTQMNGHNLGEKVAKSTISYLYSNHVQNSRKYFDTIVKSLELEGSYHLKPACNELKDGDKRKEILPSGQQHSRASRCWSGSPWSEMMQSSLANLTDPGLKLRSNVQISSQDAFWKVWLINPVHLPNITQSSCTADKEFACTVNVTTVTQATYPFVDALDFGFFPIGSDELRTKFKSIQALHVAAGVSGADADSYFKTVDDNDQVCKRLNQLSLEWALKNADKLVLQRYLSGSVQYVAGNDSGPYNAGPNWIWKALQIKEVKDDAYKTTVEITSPSMRTPVNYFVKLSAGFHYCKVLSPARALELIYSDSLRYDYKL
ncbi:hypothetical protein MP228_004322 [Amoeboaphelidium protococcarum]|nr:hypothetical protein MP228_004322 [Amoeboaphelidium protococcarum]